MGIVPPAREVPDLTIANPSLPPGLFDSELWDRRPATLFAAHQAFLRSGLRNARTLDEAIRTVARVSGKKIRVERVGADLGRLTGFVAEHDRMIRILTSATAPNIYQAWCICHELGHILCGHGRCIRDLRLGSAQGFALDRSAQVAEGQANHVALLTVRSITRWSTPAGDGAF